MASFPNVYFKCIDFHWVHTLTVWLILMCDGFWFARYFFLVKFIKLKKEITLWKLNIWVCWCHKDKQGHIIISELVDWCGSQFLSEQKHLRKWHSCAAAHFSCWDLKVFSLSKLMNKTGALAQLPFPLEAEEDLLIWKAQAITYSVTSL